jgi:Phosphotransferase enzyme family
VLTPPDDLSPEELAAALGRGWGVAAAALSYRPVGWGSHHWDLTDTAGTRWFVTVDDLATRLLRAHEPVEQAFGRLRASLAAAVGLRECGRAFVVAPVLARDGEPLQRLAGRFAVALYPCIDGQSFSWGESTPLRQRREVLDLIIAVHTAPAAAARLARADDFWIPHRDELELSLGGPADPAAGGAGDGDSGPYAASARHLLARGADPVRRLLGRYDELAARARGQAGRAVLTHGEPHPGNTMLTPAGWRLIDWDTVLIALPERDLWILEPGDGSILAAYAAATGVPAQPDLLELYRIRWDLADVAGGVSHFRRPHAGTAHDEKEWAVLRGLVERIAQ